MMKSAAPPATRASAPRTATIAMAGLRRGGSGCEMDPIAGWPHDAGVIAYIGTGRVPGCGGPDGIGGCCGTGTVPPNCGFDADCGRAGPACISPWIRSSESQPFGGPNSTSARASSATLAKRAVAVLLEAAEDDAPRAPADVSGRIVLGARGLARDDADDELGEHRSPWNGDGAGQRARRG